jgi:hypothetical protein
MSLFSKTYCRAEEEENEPHNVVTKMKVRYREAVLNVKSIEQLIWAVKGERVRSGRVTLE